MKIKKFEDFRSSKLNENHDHKDMTQIISKINEKFPTDITAYELASFCYDEYNFVTGQPQEDRNEESHFPEVFHFLMTHYKIDEEEFQEGWNNHADMMSDRDEENENENDEEDYNI